MHSAILSTAIHLHELKVQRTIHIGMFNSKIYVYDVLASKTFSNAEKVP